MGCAATRMTGATQVLGRWDPRLLRRVLANIFDRTCRDPRSGPSVLNIDHTDAIAELRIETSGVDLPHGDAPRVFDRSGNATGPAHPAGSGIGWLVLQRMISALDGTLAIVRADDKLSVRIALPKRVRR